MGDNWTRLHFEFYVGAKERGQCPDITFIVPCLAFRAELKNLIFPVESDELEFLPIVASDEDWLVVNCLRATNCYDEAKSLLHRDPSGRIFMIQKLVVTAPLPEGSELFTVDGSNRAYTYFVDSLVERIVDLGLNGLTFKEVGRIVT